MVAGLPWWVLWMVVPIVRVSLGDGGLGRVDGDFWLWIGGSVIVGVGGLAAIWAVHRWVRRPGREALARRLDDAIAGSSLRRAQAALDELRCFVAEG